MPDIDCIVRPQLNKKMQRVSIATFIVITDSEDVQTLL